MTTDLTRITGAAALAALLAAAPALAQEMSDLDTDQDMAVSEEEFTASAEGDDEAMRMNTWSRLMENWDRDQSGTISEDEYTAGTEEAAATGGAGDWSGQDFGTADADRSGDLDASEFATMIFVVYDTDQSGDLSEDEFSTYTEDQSGMGTGTGN
jgi:hypothetical protein